MEDQAGGRYFRALLSLDCPGRYVQFCLCSFVCLKTAAKIWEWLLVDPVEKVTILPCDSFHHRGPILSIRFFARI